MHNQRLLRKTSKTAIDKAAEAKAEIDQTKTAAKAKVDEAVNNAKASIDQATNNNGVTLRNLKERTQLITFNQWLLRKMRQK